jgi:hypothetical protein
MYSESDYVWCTVPRSFREKLEAKNDAGPCARLREITSQACSSGSTVLRGNARAHGRAGVSEQYRPASTTCGTRN